MPAPDARPGFGRPAHSAAFITQLAGHEVPAGAERRSRRDPSIVAPRAANAYRAASRLASELEPGFIVAKEM